MFRERKLIILAGLFLLSLLLVSCGTTDTNQKQDPQKTSSTEKVKANHTEMQNVGPHENVNQKPVPIKIKRTGNNQVNIDMTAQITNINLDKNVTYKAWTFNGTVPGPVIRVKEGDKLHINLKNMDPVMSHSIDFHSVYASPSKDFTDVPPKQTGEFDYTVGTPGVYMYHCATMPVMDHVGNGMYGMMIVEPKTGYPTDNQVDKELTIVQSEFYQDGDHQKMLQGNPEYVVFNGSTQAVKDKPIKAHVGDTIRVNIVDAGPNKISSFHVTGTQLETVYINGNPKNIEHGLQTVMIPVSGSVTAEFTVKKAGTYTMMTHALSDMEKGAMQTIEVTK